jgi:hypothetical protein
MDYLFISQSGWTVTAFLVDVVELPVAIKNVPNLHEGLRDCESTKAGFSCF